MSERSARKPLVPIVFCYQSMALLGGIMLIWSQDPDGIDASWPGPIGSFVVAALSLLASILAVLVLRRPLVVSRFLFGIIVLAFLALALALGVLGWNMRQAAGDGNFDGTAPLLILAAIFMLVITESVWRTLSSSRMNSTNTKVT